MAINKGMVIAAAAIAFGIVAVDDVTRSLVPAASSTEALSATTDGVAVENALLRRRATETLRILLEKQQGDATPKLPALSQKCREQSWPYYSDECLVRSDGTRVAPAARIVAIDRPAAGPVQVAGLR
jgi:hypothetical protein